MNTNGGNGSPREENESDRLQALIADDALSLDMVSAMGGDRELTEGEKVWFAEFAKNRGRLFFSDLIYVVTHMYFPPESAEDLWPKILVHKLELSTVLRRNVRITVAALDYLSNITPTMASPTLIGEHRIAEIVGLAQQDGLTGLYNHTFFYQQIKLEVNRYARYGTALSLAMLDIDDFKQVNDQFGHQAGDRILAAMGKTLMRVARASDICCRYGGEELAVILPLTDLHEAEEIAGRMKNELAQGLPGTGTVTVSIGVATCGEKTTSPGILVHDADAALYQAKQNGKNRVVVHKEDA